MLIVSSFPALLPYDSVCRDRDNYNLKLTGTQLSSLSTTKIVLIDTLTPSRYAIGTTATIQIDYTHSRK